MLMLLMPDSAAKRSCRFSTVLSPLPVRYSSQVISSSWATRSNSEVAPLSLVCATRSPSPSEDYEYYSGYTIPVGEGKKPEKLPTILETLLIY